MKYATILLGLAFVLASIATAQAAEPIPAQYRGSWCHPKQQGPYYRCREVSNEGDAWIGSREFYASGEWRCKPLAITAVPGGHQVRAVCRHVDAAPDDKGKPELQRWRLSPNGRRLEVKQMK
jgi:hypothetical protein